LQCRTCSVPLRSVISACIRSLASCRCCYETSSLVLSSSTSRRSCYFVLQVRERVHHPCIFENLENSPPIPCEAATPCYCSTFRIGKIAFLPWIEEQHHRDVWLRSWCSSIKLCWLALIAPRVGWSRSIINHITDATRSATIVVRIRALCLRVPK
jgi:hypothetical protein